LVTLFSEGLVPLSVLVASSIVQDGRETPPLLSAGWQRDVSYWIDGSQPHRKDVAVGIFERSEIGPMTLPNRLLMAPVKTGFGAADGTVTEQQIAYYRRRAEGGVGAIIVEPCYVDSAGKEHPRQLGIDSDDKVAGLRRLVDAIHAGGARAIAHLNHAGRAANPKATGRAPEAPSQAVCPATGATALPMDGSRVLEIVGAFAAGASRARAAGFDAVEVQCGLGYLVAQFLSPRTNQRTDEYGGDEDRRHRFARDVVAAIRESLGHEVPVLARMSATESVEGGLAIQDAQRLARQLQAWGVAALHVVSGSACDSPPWYYQHMSLPAGVNQSLAARITEVVDLPIIVAGRLGDAKDIEDVLDRGQASFVALGRPLVADPDLPRKLAQGQPEQVLACGSCLQGCLASVKAGRGIACIVNPEVGHEGEPEKPASSRRHVVIVGGGPAGLTAAIVARRRGHRVTLLERAELGGQFTLAPHAPGKAAMQRPLKALLHQATHAGAEIRTGIQAAMPLLEELAPDVVILATGASPVMLDVPGLQDAVTGNQVLAGQTDTGGRVLVIGGGLVGIELAEFLAERGKRVTIVELLDDVARDMEMITRKLTMKRLANLPVEIRTGAAITRFADAHATIRTEQGSEEIGPFDSVVVAVGTRPNLELHESLSASGVELHVVGDALESGQIMGAVRSAWQVARTL
jgi:2,4-dienoyl-CoA reductase-like NADH-dependent reductase (Old Yellow Enzyme family)/thioredoxin reductase